MDALLQQHLQALVTLLALVNPLMCGALFARSDDRQDRKVQLADATKATAAVLVILLLAALFGVRVLHILGSVRLICDRFAGYCTTRHMKSVHVINQPLQPQAGTASSNP